jgi:hypothetical protein
MLDHRQKAFVGLFVLAVGALGADRLFLAEPAPASASPPPAPLAIPAVASPAPAKAILALEIDRPPESLPQRLRRLQPPDQAGAERLRDVFSLSASWIKPEVEPVAPRIDPVEQFRRSHRVTATLLNGQRSQAMVNGRFITLGQSVDGFRLVSVTSRSATFESDQASVTLPVTAETGRPGGQGA